MQNTAQQENCIVEDVVFLKKYRPALFKTFDVMFKRCFSIKHSFSMAA